MLRSKTSNLPDEKTTFSLITIVANLLLLFVFNEKSYLLVPIFYGIFLFLFTKLQLIETVFFTLLLVLPFEHGLRSWFVPVVPSGPESWINGYSFYFGYSLKLVFSLSLILLLIGRFWTQRYKLTSHWLLIPLWLMLTVISAILAPRLDIGILYCIRLIVPVACLCGGYLLVSSRPKIRSLIIISLTCTLFLQSFIGSYQTLTHHLTHTFLEESSFNNGFFTTDAVSVFRASGLMGHPTFYGAFLTMLLPIILGFYLSINAGKLSRISLLLVILVTLLSIYGTISRSAWITTVFIGIIFLRYWFKDHQVVKSTISHSFAKIVIIGSISLIAWNFGSVIFNRIESLSTFLTLGNGRARIALIDYSFKMITNSPWFGVGPNHFTSAMVKYGLNEATTGFTFPVHNVFLLIASETGLLTSAVITLFVVLTLTRSYRLARRQPLIAGLWLGCIAYVLNSQVHPLLGQDPTFDYLMLILGMLSIPTTTNT